MSNTFSNKTIALTGSASGIGLATAHLLASRGASLSLADVNGEALERAAKDIQEKHSVEVHTAVVDVRKEGEVRDWVESIVERYGGLDGAANLAGVIDAPGKSIGVKGVVDQDISEWDFIMDVNLKGVMLCLKAQLGKISDGGSIVNASSIAGIQGRANNAAYAASKHGVIGLSRSAAKEVGVKGVRVNCICPGYIETPMNAHARKIAEAAANGESGRIGDEAMNVSLRRKGKAEEVASLIAFLLGDESRFITGASYSIDGGWQM
ncbi:NAD(P)-binding protein [Lophiostoma macrostomum CBS 122681]|uniref:NAD(P)-binding protein n=1 Tax=Lophiostoma macrostomum CBS 122681 TaxID=1314788 RepID=A0A6A6TFD8_9PLEO|nr:NAD(P)-binding protein [Lophiostoma macrostomum CBS 122681]